MALPESYYGPGSYNNWIKVGLALKETSEKLFYTWMLFSSQSSQFKYEDIEKFYDTWSRFSSNKDNPVTYRSIMYWVKTEIQLNTKKLENKQLIIMLWRQLNNIRLGLGTSFVYLI